MEPRPPEITRAVTPADLGKLLRSARCAAIAWADGARVAAEPVAFHSGGSDYTFGLRPGVFPGGAEVTLVVDAGPMYFHLRGVRVRGAATRAPAHGEGGLEWFQIAPEREVAWHYGRMRNG